MRPVVVHYHNGVAEVDVALSADWRVRPDEQLLSQLGEWLTPARVRVVYSFAFFFTPMTKCCRPTGRRVYVTMFHRVLMKTVKIRQLKNNPSEPPNGSGSSACDLRIKVSDMHLSVDRAPGRAGVRLAIATDLYRSESVTLGRGARVAGIPLEDFMRHVSREGIPVIRGDAKTLREDLKNVEAWRKRSSPREREAADRARECRGTGLSMPQLFGRALSDSPSRCRARRRT